MCLSIARPGAHDRAARGGLVGGADRHRDIDARVLPPVQSVLGSVAVEAVVGVGAELAPVLNSPTGKESRHVEIAADSTTIAARIARELIQLLPSVNRFLSVGVRVHV